MGRWISFGNLLERITNISSAFLAAVMSLVVVWQAFARYVLNTGQFWAEEFAVICMFWLALLGASGALWSGHHIGLRIVVERLSSKSRGVVQTVTELLLGVFAVLLMIQGFELVARTSGGDWSALRIPLGYTYVVLPLSAGLMALLSIMKGTLRAISIFRGGEIPASWSTDQDEL